jgi:hypothetical protein
MGAVPEPARIWEGSPNLPGTSGNVSQTFPGILGILGMLSYNTKCGGEGGLGGEGRGRP